MCSKGRVLLMVSFLRLVVVDGRKVLTLLICASISLAGMNSSPRRVRCLL